MSGQRRKTSGDRASEAGSTVRWSHSAFRFDERMRDSNVRFNLPPGWKRNCRAVLPLNFCYARLGRGSYGAEFGGGGEHNFLPSSLLGIHRPQTWRPTSLKRPYHWPRDALPPWNGHCIDLVEEMELARLWNSLQCMAFGFCQKVCERRCTEHCRRTCSTLAVCAGAPTWYLHGWCGIVWRRRSRR